MSTRYLFGDTISYKVRFENAAGVGIANATGVIYIYRNSDKQFWNGSAFQVGRVSLTMFEISETNQIGQWVFEFPTNLTGALAIDEYIAEFEDTSGNSVNRSEFDSALVGGFIDPIVTDIKRLLGLSHENFVLDPTAFTTNGIMSAGDVYIYDSKANADADGRTIATGAIAKYAVVSPHSSTTGQLIKFTQTKEVLT